MYHYPVSIDFKNTSSGEVVTLENIHYTTGKCFDNDTVDCSHFFNNTHCSLTYNIAIDPNTTGKMNNISLSVEFN